MVELAQRVGSTRYVVSLIGPGRVRVEPEAVFGRKVDAVAYATGGLTRFLVYEAWVQRERLVENLQLWESDPAVVWTGEDYVFQKRRLLTPEEVAHRQAEDHRATLAQLGAH